MNTSDKKSESKAKLIAAGITLLLGIILAIGYPTGGVKANKIQHRQVVLQNVVSTQSSTSPKSAVVKKETSKKKRVISIALPPSNDDSQEEGC